MRVPIELTNTDHITTIIWIKSSKCSTSSTMYLFLDPILIKSTIENVIAVFHADDLSETPLPLLKFVQWFKALYSRLKGHWWHYEIPAELLATESSTSAGWYSPHKWPKVRLRAIKWLIKYFVKLILRNWLLLRDNMLNNFLIQC